MWTHEIGRKDGRAEPHSTEKRETRDEAAAMVHGNPVTVDKGICHCQVGSAG